MTYHSDRHHTTTINFRESAAIPKMQLAPGTTPANKSSKSVGGRGTNSKPKK